MPRRSTPYLQRRGDTFAFRIGVPVDLRPCVEAREITKSLCTSYRQCAIPKALEWAARIKRVFGELREAMASDQDLEAAVRAAELQEQCDTERKKNLQRLVQDTKLKIALALSEERNQNEFDQQRIRHMRELEVARLQGENEVMRRILAQPQPIHLPVQENAIAAQETPSAPMLSELVARFLQSPEIVKVKAMLGKHKQVLPVLMGVIGDKPVNRLRQSDVVEIFDVIRALPTYWYNDHKKGLSFQEIIKLPGRSLLGESAFTGTYRASISRFIGWAVTNYQDQGFPTTLTVERIQYTGDKKKGQQQTQRAFTPDELKRLFEGPEMKAFAADPNDAHWFWLAHIGLFTGARINEICQINPQTDVKKDASGIWYLLISEDTESHDDVEKSVKTGVTRAVPVHSKLLELGLLDYVERVKRSGSKLIFPEWKPKQGRAAGNTIDDFINLLKSVGIHGVKNEAGRAIRGSHAFRHTLLSYGKVTKPTPLNLRCITGHKERSENRVADGYEDETIICPLAEKKRLLDQLDYGIAFYRPVV